MCRFEGFTSCFHIKPSSRCKWCRFHCRPGINYCTLIPIRRKFLDKLKLELSKHAADQCFAEGYYSIVGH